VRGWNLSTACPRPPAERRPFREHPGPPPRPSARRRRRRARSPAPPVHTRPLPTVPMHMAETSGRTTARACASAWTIRPDGRTDHAFTRVRASERGTTTTTATLFPPPCRPSIRQCARYRSVRRSHSVPCAASPCRVCSVPCSPVKPSLNRPPLLHSGHTCMHRVADPSLTFARERPFPFHWAGCLGL
jgi:hypothetical protein